MRHMSLSDLDLGLTDLLAKRRAALELSALGKGYVSKLESALQRISALPAALIGGKAFAVELEEKDAEHDGLGGAVWYMTEAYLRHPKVSAEVRQAAKRIRATFIPALQELSAKYIDEAAAAKKRKLLITEHETDLKRIPVVENQTLLDWVNDFLDAGLGLDALLSERANVMESSRKDAASLRSSTIGLLNRARAAVADDVEENPALPRDLDAQVFGYIDTLSASREDAVRAAAAAAKAKAKKDEPATPPG